VYSPVEDNKRNLRQQKQNAASRETLYSNQGRPTYHCCEKHLFFKPMKVYGKGPLNWAGESSPKSWGARIHVVGVVDVEDEDVAAIIESGDLAISEGDVAEVGDLVIAEDNVAMVDVQDVVDMEIDWDDFLGKTLK
jgi:hypothetical protein